MKRATSGIPDKVSDSLDALTHELKEVGIAYVGHGVVSTHGDHTGYFADRTWRDIYLSKKFFHQCPVLEVFKLNPFRVVHWDLDVEDNEVHVMRSKMIGISSGITFCNFYNSYFTFFNVAFPNHVDTEQYVKELSPLMSAYHKHYDRTHLGWRMVDLKEPQASLSELQTMLS